MVSLPSALHYAPSIEFNTFSTSKKLKINWNHSQFTNVLLARSLQLGVKPNSDSVIEHERIRHFNGHRVPSTSKVNPDRYHHYFKPQIKKNGSTDAMHTFYWQMSFSKCIPPGPYGVKYQNSLMQAPCCQEVHHKLTPSTRQILPYFISIELMISILSGWTNRSIDMCSAIPGELVSCVPLTLEVYDFIIASLYYYCGQGDY
jgi:hypothetical protein